MAILSPSGYCRSIRQWMYQVDYFIVVSQVCVMVAQSGFGSATQQHECLGGPTSPSSSSSSSPTPPDPPRKPLGWWWEVGEGAGVQGEMGYGRVQAKFGWRVPSCPLLALLYSCYLVVVVGGYTGCS